MKKEKKKKNVKWLTWAQIIISVALVGVVVWFFIINSRERLKLNDICTLPRSTGIQISDIDITITNFAAQPKEIRAAMHFTNYAAYSSLHEIPPVVYSALSNGSISVTNTASVRGIDFFTMRVKSINFLYLGLSLVIFIIALVIDAFTWYLMLRFSKFKISFPEVLRYFFVGTFFNNLLPGAVGGDIVKGVMLGVDAKNAEIVASSIIVDRLMNLLMVTFIMLIAWLTIYWDAPIVKEFKYILYIIVGGIFFCAIFYLIGPSQQWLLSAIKIIKNKKINNALTMFVNSLYRFRKKRFLGMVGGITLVGQGLRITMNYLAALSLGVRSLAIWNYFFIIPVVGITTALPVTFNGIGIREVVGKQLLVSLHGMNAIDSILIMTVGHVVIVASSLIGGVMLPMRGLRVKR